MQTAQAHGCKRLLRSPLDANPCEPLCPLRLSGRGRREDMGLELQPLDLNEAYAFVEQYHRHHRRPVGGKFAIGVHNGEKVVGVAVAGRPVAIGNSDGWTLEVTRLATDGSRNACSILYAACWRAARAMGYRRLITYTLPEEGGASLRATGFKLIGLAGGGTWNRPHIGRYRVDKHPTQQKFKWELTGAS